MNQQDAFEYVLRSRETRPAAELHAVCDDASARAQRFHAGFPGYAPTPLIRLDGLAGALGVGRVYVKDESQRFDLNAFKVLGGGYAMGCCLAEKLGRSIDECSFDFLASAQTRKQLGDVTFITATDGNHGRGVAWMARRLGQRAVVYMPKGTAPERLENVRREGAQASILDCNYDGCVHLAEQHARENGWILTQDTAWDGYEEIPTRIMQGYTTIAREIDAQLAAMSEDAPTHILLQAGVGSFAAAMLGYYTAKYGDARPVSVIVEPKAADCILRTARADDGKLRFVTGDMPTIMAGLACGEPSTVSWRILDAYADAFLSMPDSAAAGGMRMLGNPLPGDTRIISGESGASTAGALREIMVNPALAELREKLGFGPDARVLLISTEGDTDRENYRRIVWDGAHPNLR
ncbi:MAG: diaminopropionate ammonia-lyase [Clostridia bacterium]|nr:diaminopropionate ammonia-lyase [Clostridia bacterium]